MKQSTMSTMEVANRYCELAKQNNWTQILDELCSENLVNKEPDHAAGRGIQPITQGLEHVKAKGAGNRAKIEAVHSQQCSAPLVAGNFFTVTLTRDVTYFGRPRMNLEEIAVFEVHEGRILSEQFFY